MAKKTPQIQEGFLFAALRERRPLRLETMGGGTIRGTLQRFDAYTLIVDTKAGQLVVYKSAVAAIREDDPSSEEP